MNALRENKDVAFLSKTLATIMCSVDEDSESFSSVSLNDLSLRKIDQLAFSAFLDSYQFRDTDQNRLNKMVSNLTQ